MKKAALVYTDDYRHYDFGPSHPMKPIRQQMTYDLIQAEGLLDHPDAALVAPESATESEILTVHDEAYVNAVKRLSAGETLHGATRFGFGMLDNPPFRGMYEASLLYTGGTLTAGRLIARGEAQIAFNPSGGLHHAMRDRASGFCIFDDAAVAIKELLKQYNRIVYLDIDAHHGDGVQSEFYRSSRVMTISQHESGQYLFPGSGSVDEMGTGEGLGYAVNIPVPPDTDDEIHLWAFKEIVPPLITQYNPDLIVFQMGADAHYQDPLTQLNVTTAAYQEMFQTVISMQKPILALGGGGYHMPAVPRIWTLAFATFLGRDLSDEIPEWYQKKYRIQMLRDNSSPKLRSSEKLEIWNQVRQTVDEIKRKVFPIHQLK